MAVYNYTDLTKVLHWINSLQVRLERSCRRFPTVFSEIAREITRSTIGPIAYPADISVDGIVCSWILEEVSCGVSVVVVGVD